MVDIVNYINRYLIARDINVDIRNSALDIKIIAVLLVLYELKGDSTVEFKGIDEYFKILNDAEFFDLTSDISVLANYSKKLKCTIKKEYYPFVKNIKCAKCLDKIIQNKLGELANRERDYVRIERMGDYTTTRVLPWQDDILPWTEIESAFLENITNVEDISVESRDVLIGVLVKGYPNMLIEKGYIECSENGCRNRFINNYLNKAKKVLQSRMGVVTTPEKERIARNRVRIESERRMAEGEVDIDDIYKRQKAMDSKITKRLNKMIKKKMLSSMNRRGVDELFKNLKINN